MFNNHKGHSMFSFFKKYKYDTCDVEKIGSDFKYSSPVCMSIRGIELAHYTAIGYLSTSLRWYELAPLIISYYLNLSFLWDGKFGNFTLSPKIFILRDSSKSGFIGELGQGLSVYHFSKIRYGKHCDIEDFDQYVIRKNCFKR